MKQDISVSLGFLFFSAFGFVAPGNSLNSMLARRSDEFDRIQIYTCGYQCNIREYTMNGTYGCWDKCDPENKPGTCTQKLTLVEDFRSSYADDCFNLFTYNEEIKRGVRVTEKQKCMKNCDFPDVKKIVTRKQRRGCFDKCDPENKPGTCYNKCDERKLTAKKYESCRNICDELKDKS